MEDVGCEFLLLAFSFLLFYHLKHLPASPPHPGSLSTTLGELVYSPGSKSYPCRHLSLISVCHLHGTITFNLVGWELKLSPRRAPVPRHQLGVSDAAKFSNHSGLWPWTCCLLFGPSDMSPLSSFPAHSSIPFFISLLGKPFFDLTLLSLHSFPAQTSPYSTGSSR